ncbi:NUDIX hydrolase [Dyadobacter sp. CY356]|uniref:NUDIX domain-containing protein n=1 Tax=Dyadobacter sp. CY356 TaxID=2906442 RepID=UPI001F29508D|nr:NUDIX hydrolase [Dyadobacter sp. CY356]MCF0055725.1 NUDIX hydrolase [Dyadobacter sp. CY356]
MDAGKNELIGLYGSRLRIRVCGICVDSEKILMIRHRFVGNENIFWSPPGGGMQFGESAAETLKREFQEETGLIVEAGEMLFVNEFIQPPLHAVELFFKIKFFAGQVIKGIDPEFSEENQIIREVRFMSIEEIKLLPVDHVHNLFQNCDTIDEVLSLRGYHGAGSGLSVS